MKKNTKNQKTKNLSGTREWAKQNVNFITGCHNDCKYCYAKEMAIRFGRVLEQDWQNEAIRSPAQTQNYRKRTGRIMFPSTHDITPIHLTESIAVLRKLLCVENEVIIVTKPHFDCIKRICTELVEYKSQIVFRFTIGSADSTVLKFWEPNAPSFEERLECLQYAFGAGYETSVSCEPMLDDNISAVIEAVSPFVTDSIWVGKANLLLKRLNFNGHTDKLTISEANKLVQWQSDRSNILALKAKYANDSLIKWKNGM